MHRDQSNNNENGKKRYKCDHGNQRSKCIDCGGIGICEHRRQRRACKDCRGNDYCEHD